MIRAAFLALLLSNAHALTVSINGSLCPAASMQYELSGGKDVVTLRSVACPPDEIFRNGFGG